MKTKGRWLVWFLALVGIFAAFPVAAQDIELGETFSFDDGTTFQYPEAWSLNYRRRDLYAVLLSDDTQILIPESSFLGDSAEGELGDALKAYFDEVYQGDLTFDADDVEAAEIGGREAARYAYEDTFGDGALLIALRLADGGIGLVDAVSLGGDLSEEDIVLAVAASLVRGEGDAGGGSDTPVVSEPCTVRTESGNTVALRVGPG